jgi:hypothetical protein
VEMRELREADRARHRTERAARRPAGLPDRWRDGRFRAASNS